MRVNIMSGPSGSGKSHYVEEKRRKNDFVVSADHYFMINGLYRYDRLKLGEAHKACMRNFLNCVQNERERGFTLWVDNTNIALWEIAPYYQVAEAFDLPVRVVEVMPASIQVCIERNVHGVPASVIHRQFRRMQTRDMPSWVKLDLVFT